MFIKFNSQFIIITFFIYSKTIFFIFNCLFDKYLCLITDFYLHFVHWWFNLFSTVALSMSRVNSLVLKLSTLNPYKTFRALNRYDKFYTVSYYSDSGLYEGINYKFYENCLFCIPNTLCHDIRHLTNFTTEWRLIELFSDLILLHYIIFIISYVTKSFST